MSQPSGTAVIYNRPFGPLCLIGCPNGRGTCNADVKPTPGDGPRWDNIGTDEKPTLTPSYHCIRGCGWHGYVVNGELRDAPPGVSSIVACSECKHPHMIRVEVSADRRCNINVDLAFSDLAPSSGSNIKSSPS
jgi:hypothetical protein